MEKRKGQVQGQSLSFSCILVQANPTKQYSILAVETAPGTTGLWLASTLWLCHPKSVPQITQEMRIRHLKMPVHDGAINLHVQGAETSSTLSSFLQMICSTNQAWLFP